MRTFYNRETELAILRRADSIKKNRGVFTVVYGRRRIGKTTLVLQAESEDPKLYFFVSKKDESLLCEEFIQEIEFKLKVNVFGSFRKVEDLLSYLFELAKNTSFTLIIDEFQEFTKVNAALFSVLQKLWDLNKETAKIHLIACGSIYSLMKLLFENSKEPLFGRADFKLDVQPFAVSVLKEILVDNQAFTNRNLLDYYLLTGGVAKYIDLFLLRSAYTKEQLVDEIFAPMSLFLDEGKARLVEEFGRDYTTYFSILSLIASSKTSKGEMESVIDKNLSAYLSKLEHEYSIIKSKKPFGAKVGSKMQKYEITDNFLSFWFRFIYKYQSLIESMNYESVKEIALRDYDMYSGKFLEKLYIDVFKQSGKFVEVGSYWERGHKNEIDIVALDEKKKQIWFCEIKLNESRLRLNELIQKSQYLCGVYSDYEPVYKLISLNQIDSYLNELISKKES